LILTYQLCLPPSSRSEASRQRNYETPDALTKDPELSSEEKKKALDVWEQDARQMLTASNEGMPGSEESVKSIRGDRHLDNKGAFALIGDRLSGAIK
jgi:hypothetical protein